MAYRRETLDKYLEDAAARLPAPGGGSVSALTGALAAAMGAMAARFTLGKKKFKKVEPQVKSALDVLDKAMERLSQLVDEDTLVYEKVLGAYAMSKETEEQKKLRNEAIQSALREALSVPLEIARSARRVAETAAQMVDISNPMLITDVGVCAIMAEAACQGARLNVDINLNQITDPDFVAEVSEELSSICAAALQAKTKVAGCINAYLTG